MTGIEQAPQLDREHECPNCGEDDSYVRYDGDTVCSACNYTPTPRRTNVTVETPWVTWWEHRRTNYDGLKGDERARMVGGFIQPYDI